MSDIPHPRSHDIDFSRQHDDVTEDRGPDLETGDDLDTGAIVGGPGLDDEEPDDGAGSEAP